MIKGLMIAGMCAMHGMGITLGDNTTAGTGELDSNTDVEICCNGNKVSKCNDGRSVGNVEVASDDKGTGSSVIEN